MATEADIPLVLEISKPNQYSISATRSALTYCSFLPQAIIDELLFKTTQQNR